jgi:uncharacterized protein (TIGR03000 family)
MFQKTFSFTGILLLAGAAVLMMPGLSQAQHGGGHGGNQFSGGHFGGYHGGVYHGGYRYGYPHDYSYRHNGYYSHYPSYGYYGGNGYGYYGGNGYYSNYYSDYSAPGYDLGSTNSNGAVDRYPYDNPRLQPDLRDSGPFPLDNSVAQPDTTAHITVGVPANGKVWFDGSEMTSTGTIREYRSPPLTPGGRYSYEVQARWNERGRDVTQMQRIDVSAGARVSVNFPVPPRSGG